MELAAMAEIVNRGNPDNQVNPENQGKVAGNPDNQVNPENQERLEIALNKATINAFILSAACG
ncbi:hypothetical protein NTE_02618 [Candidatus Nitrososphaera evergladensis SR1]|uniref:Uncharacterized protein n=1 Tax=Candidatus Nitrososphaera evergladensis SR1 TaxID=1459636 RepID=A0A075MSV6_9ARCH|nr:hypothetical protein [Candidatus Nitrososphaera evergladensis]AIF84661.1 hypothetical protein NTE_02618 [Candidatus Nitrososphaera evergladensis SR1]